MVGLDRGDWIQMMWQTCLASEPGKCLYDFKYLGRKSAFGLNKPAVFTEGDLGNVFEVFRRKTGKPFLSLRPALTLEKGAA
jgi:hypothetical protein